MNPIEDRRARAAITRCLPAAPMLLALLFASGAWGWNDAGHMVAALIAYDMLSAPQQTAAGALLRKHPRFAADFEPNLPRAFSGATAPEQNRWYFAFAATWPDLARHFGQVRSPEARASLIDRYNHGPWHYIDLPTYLRPSDEQQLNRKVPSMVWNASLRDSDLNIVQALQRLGNDFCRAGAPDEDRALALSWLLHLIGDLYQPLHTTSLYAVGFFPNGDRGGNDVVVRGATTLHALWDGALGNDRRWRRITTMAVKLGADSHGDGEVAFRELAGTGRDLAARMVYSEAVRGAVVATPVAGTVHISLDSSYRSVMRQTAESQINLAGAETALVVARLLDPESTRRCHR